MAEEELFGTLWQSEEEEEETEEELWQSAVMGEEEEKDESRRGIVDWNAVFKELSGKAVLFEDVKRLVKKQYGKVLSYSEWKDEAERMSLKEGVLVLSRKRRIGNRVRRLWYIKVVEGPFNEQYNDIQAMTKEGLEFPGDGIPWNEIFKKKVKK